MKKITSPLKKRQKSAAVRNLQDALQDLLARGSLLPNDEPARGKLANLLKAERAKKTYGSATHKLVSAFQAEQALKAHGEVDEATAKALNGLLLPFDFLPPLFQSPLHEGAKGPDVALVHEVLAGLGLSVAPNELREKCFGRTTVEAVLAWQKQLGLPLTGALDLNALKQLWTKEREIPRVVRGIVKLDDETPVPGLVVVAIDRDFRSEQILGEAVTDRQGRYRIEYTTAAFLRAEKGSADVGVKVTTADKKTLLYTPTSRDLIMNAPYDTVIDVTVSLLPAGAVPSEFERIASELRPLIGDVPVGDVAKQAGSDEGDFLAREVGFDEARLAHFVVSHRVAALSKVRPEYFYALLREDGLFGIGPNRPRAVQVPVGFQSDSRAVLFEAVLLDADLAKAAIRRAVRKRLVPPSVEKEADEIKAVLQRRRQEALDYVSKEVPRNILGLVENLIEASKTEETLAFLGSFDIADLGKLYEGLDSRGVFAAANKEQAETRLKLGELLGFNLGLVEEITESLGATTPDDVRKLARLQRKDWTDLITRGTARVSLGGQPIDPAHARRQSSIIARRFEKRFPTVAFAAQLSRRKPPTIREAGKLAAFLETHPELELREHNLVPFLKKAGVDPKSVAPEIMEGVEMLQRVFQLTGDYRKTEGLLAAGYSAAADIVAAGRLQFVADAKGFAGMGAGEATRVFRAAENTNLGAVMLATNLRTLSWPAALGGATATTFTNHVEKIIAEQPDLKGLFGSTDVCECRQCRSIYGPAAYFSDVMRFLRNRLVKDTTVAGGGPSTKTAKDVLFSRRPDLGEIDLNCENAEVPVPHIDIVCELLEEAVAPDPGFAFNGAIAAGAASAPLLATVRAAGFEVGPAALVYGPYAPDRFMLRDKSIVIAVDGPGPWKLRRLRQTHGSAEERAASPEYVNAAAYTIIASGKAAFGLPFDLFHAETCAFLAAAGIDRAGLMEALAVGGAPSPEAIAGEVLGLSAGESALIFAPSVANQAQIWALPGPLAAPAVPLCDFDAAGESLHDRGMQALDVFARKTGLEYREIERLLTGQYVRSGVDLYIRHCDNSCNLSKKAIVNLDDAALDRMHRVLRLARKTSLAPRDIDRLAASAKLGAGNLGNRALRSLADLVRLSADLNVQVGRLITWLDIIPIDGEPSEHALLFQNPAATGVLDVWLTPAKIRESEANEAALLGSGQPIAAVAADIALAFGIGPADFQMLIGRLSEAALFGANPALSFRILAALYGRIGLARALGLKAAALVGLERLSAADPLASSSSLRDLVKAARAVEKIGVAVAELEYRLARRAADLASWDLADDAITPVLKTIREGLAAAAEANRSPYDALLPVTEQVTAFETLLQRQPELKAADIATLSNLIRFETPTAVDGTAAKAVVDGPLAGLVDGIAVKADIDAIIAAPPGAEAPRQAMLQHIMDDVSKSALKLAAFAAANAPVATLLRIPEDLSAVILHGRKPLWRGAQLLVGVAQTPLADLLTTGTITTGVALSFATTPDLYRAVRLAHSVAGMIAPFDPSTETIAFLFENATGLGWLALDDTPFEAGRPPIALSKWLELADVFALISEYPATPLPGRPDQTVTALTVFELALGVGPGKGPFLDALAILTGWPRAEVGDADARFGFTLAAYRAPAIWRRLERAVALIHSLAVPFAEAVSYTAMTLGDADRRNARRMLKARYNEADWLGALKGIMDPIREQKRDALVAQVLATNPGVTSKADLYDYFLTDTEWSAKMPSSRLVHAHGTLQLYVQRCIAALEPKATADLEGDLDWRLWDWMKNYRVWEVNRKVFVEAQYYIRPEWRDDKTEPFADMESALLQNEINDENINAAFEGYLDRLDQIAFLDVLATCYDFDRDDMHVFASTKGGEPRSYFHRVLQRERVWTAWKKIDLDITGEHLIAFFRNKRLFLAWAIFLEKGDDQQQATYPTPAPGAKEDMPRAERQTEISLAISEYTGKKWLPRRVSEGVLVTPKDTRSLDQKKIFLTVTPSAERFTVDVYLSTVLKYGSEGSISYLSRLGYYLLTGCKGYPEAVQGSSGVFYLLPQFKDALPRGQRIVEQGKDGDDELAISCGINGSGFQTLFGRTPGIFRVTYPFQASELDRLISAIITFATRSYARDGAILIFGSLMPFFFEDNRRGYVLTPGFYGGFDDKAGTWRTAKTFSNVRRLFLDVLALINKYLRLLAGASTTADKEAVLQGLATDPEFARILEEIASYRETHLGIIVRNFYHPLACRLRERFFEGGVPALLARATQLEVGPFRFEDPTAGYAPNPIIFRPYPKEELEFGRESAYGAYNWELTFHAPHLIASKLMQAERFDEAETWLRYIFNPLGTSNDPAPKRYWNTKPFYLRDPAEYGEQLLTTIMDRLARDPNGATETELADAILEWRRNPFKPYLVARSRTVAFQQAIVDLTIRVFIGRGDQYFRRDQLEDLVMASLDYSRAERLLGPRPKLVPPAVGVPSETYNQLEAKIDLFGNALRKIENLLPDLSVLPHGGAELPPPPLALESLYFCVPPSEKLFNLWDLLEERQFNLRNSRTIEGVERSLSLFAPPLSVEELIKATAAGLSVAAILAGLSAPRPPYRFRVMLRHAIELADVATAFNRGLHQALSSRDAEGLARLKVGQEIHILQEQTSMLKDEIKAAGKTLESAKKTRLIQQETQTFYAGRPYMNDWEIAANISYGISFALQAVVAIGYAASGGLSLIPNFMIGAAGFGGSPTVNAQTGGREFASSARDFVVGAVGALGAAFDKAGSMLEHQGNYLVRQEDWKHSAKTAQREVEKSDIEIVIAGIREGIAKEQLRLHGVKQQQAAAEETYLKTKFTNRELFDWVAQRLEGLSRQMFKLAGEAASAAERAFNFELGLTESFIRQGQWNDTRHGLLAGDNLIADLRQMESAHLKRNVREREITKHLSLARLDPIALIELRTAGRCVIQIPEAVFDLEHPGQYFRRIKALSISVPCVAGPYTSVPLKLTQTSNRVRVETTPKPGAASAADAYAEDPGADTRFRYNVGSIQSIATSRGEDDSGLFSLDLGDERYLPFEGSGLCGTFVAELPQTLRPFDYGTISDVVLNLRYTARDGGGGFRTMVADGVRERLNVIALKTGRVGLFQAFDLRRDRPDVWQKLITTGAAALTFTADDLPYYTSSRAIAINASRILARIKGAPASYNITVGGAPVALNAPAEAELAGLLSSSVLGVAMGTPVTISAALPTKIEEMIVIVNYAMTP
jgi:peptidoglycan hydrolase-like protein with peptidoglycan-binding domain